MTCIEEHEGCLFKPGGGGLLVGGGGLLVGGGGDTLQRQAGSEMGYR